MVLRQRKSDKRFFERSKLNKKPSSKKHGKIIVHHDDGDYDEYEHVPTEEKKGIFARLFGSWTSSPSSSDNT